MKAEIGDRNSIKVLQKCMACLSKFSVDFYIVVLSDGLDLVATNDKDTVVVIVTLKNSFFDSFDSECIERNLESPIFSGKLLIKPVFNSLRLEKELKSLTLTSEKLTIKIGKDDRIYFDLDHSLLGVEKKFAFTYQDILPPLNPRDFVRTTYYNKFSLTPEAFLNMVETIPTDVIYGTLSMKQNAFSIFSSGTEIEGRSLETTIDVDLDDFTEYSVQEEYNLYFNMRDLRKAVEFAASIVAAKDIEVTNAGPGSSLILKFNSSDDVVTEFVLATSEDPSWTPATELRNQDSFHDTQNDHKIPLEENEDEEEIICSSPERGDEDDGYKRSLFGEFKNSRSFK